RSKSVGYRERNVRNASSSSAELLVIAASAFSFGELATFTRVKVASSPKLKALAAMTNNSALLDEAFLTFLSRYPTDFERSKALPFLAKATTAALKNTAVEDLAWVCINKVDFLFSY